MENAITGRTSITLGGVERELVGDMNAAAVLYKMHGEAWQVWIAEHFLGDRVRRDDGGIEQKLAPITPEQSIDVLYALLASSREDLGVSESPASLRRVVGFLGLQVVQVACLRAVLAGLSLPGEYIEAVAKAADGPREVVAAKAPGGTGRKPSRLRSALFGLLRKRSGA